MKIGDRQFVRIMALLAGIAMLYFVQDALFPIVIAVILFYLLDPLASFLSRPRPKGLGINRIMAILISATVFILAVTAAARIILPPLIIEFNRLIEVLSGFLADFSGSMAQIKNWYAGFHLPEQANNIIADSIKSLVNYMVNTANQFANTTVGVFSQSINLIIIPMITFYLLKDKKNILSGTLDLMPEEHREKAETIIRQIHALLRSYFSGVFILCLLVGLACGLGLYLLGVRMFLVLGLIAAITEFIPAVGPTIGAVPAVIIALISSPSLAVKVLALYIVIQGVENSVLVPRILGNKLNLHPLSVIMALLLLSKLIGVWGLFFAAPISGIIKILYTELRKE
jgi:predicted PurR-regulated permease PerM